MHIQWPLVLFTLFIGLGTGCFAFVSALDLMGKAEAVRRTGAWISLGALAAGGVASVFHLSYPLRALQVFGHLTTPMGLEVTFLGLTALAMVAYLLVKAGAARKVAAAVGLVLSAGLAFVVGYSYVLPARPAWDTPLLPLAYLLSACVLGLFAGLVLLALQARRVEAVVQGTTRAALVAVLAQALVVFLFAVNLLATATNALAGSVTVIFWLLVVGIGLLVPFVLTLRVQVLARRPAVTAALGLLCVLAGGVAQRALMYIIGQIYPLPL